MLFLQASEAPDEGGAPGGHESGRADERKRGKMPWLKWVIILVFILAAIGAAIIIIFTVIPQKSTDQSKFSINYTVKVDDPNVKILGVDVEMRIDKLSSKRIIDLYKGKVNVPMVSCADDSGNNVNFTDNGNFLAIGPIGGSAKSVSLRYNVRVGDPPEDYSSTNVYGDLYRDLLVFSGENVLVSPYIDLSDITNTEKYISSVSFKLDANYGWKAIIPYREALSDDCSFTVDKPTWSVFNAINKSAFCFGQFERIDIGAGDGVYIDKTIEGNIPNQSLEVLVTFVQYYSGLFGLLSPDAPLTLLRSSDSGAMILGGVGAKGAALSAQLNRADDCQTLSSTLYHLYFDSKVKAPNLRYPPNNWVYAGLSDFCIRKSSTFLSQSVKDAFSITYTEDPEMTYLEYLYFSLKEPGFLVLNPSMEGSMAIAQNEYYMSIKVPVMIDFINYAMANNGGGNLITALTEMGGQEKNLDINALLKAKCGSDYEAVLRYFSGNALVPNYNSYNVDNLYSGADIVSQLTDEETNFSNLFAQEQIAYDFMPLYLLDPNKFYPAAEARGVRYNTAEIEAEVKGFSKTLDQLLMEYAMYAKLAGVDDITQPKLSGQLYSDENIAKWEAFCNSLGYKMTDD